MKIKVIAICCAILLSGSYDAQAQGFLGKLKKIGKKIEEKVKDDVVEKATGTVNSAADNTVNSVTKGKVSTSPVKMKSKSTSKQSARDKRLNDQVTAIMGPDGNRNMEDEEPTTRILEQHTALLAPYGYDVDAKYGRLSQKPQVPPAKAADQVDWVGKQPQMELDNASLVAEYKKLKEAEAGGKIDFSFSPAWHYLENIEGILLDRINAIEGVYKGIQEARSEYKMKVGDETYNWVINGIHDRLVRTLDSGGYKQAVRSSLEPLFTMKDFFRSYEDTKKYYEEHGGLKDAHKVKWTVWDPKPNKTQVKTSTGQTATVVNSGKTGSTIDINGVRYIIHVKQRQAIVKQSFKTAVEGKDIVIPDKVEHDGVMYPVKVIGASAFEGAGIRSIKIPSSVEKIGLKAFRGNNMTEVIIPASVKIVEGSAFNQCQNLTKVVFQAQSMEEIHGCFSWCTKLQSVTFPSSLTKDMSYDMLRGCTSLTNVVLPKNLRTIPATMFTGCKNLKTINIPTTVTKIGNRAFDGCGVTSLYLPNLKDIEEGAFSGCKSLKSLSVSKSFVEKLKENNYWLFVTNFEDNVNFQLKVNGNTLSLPSSIKVL